MLFLSNMEKLSDIPRSLLSGELIQEEPMLYGFSIEEAMKQGGELTRAAICEILSDVKQEVLAMAKKGYHPVIDTKSVLLMPGQYPCIPGWHCDGVIRGSRGEQPDITTVSEPIVHYIVSVSDAGIAHTGTEYPRYRDVIIDDKLIDPDNVWGSISKEAEDIGGHFTVNGGIYKFTRSCLHRGTPAKERGWRWFFRLSFYHMPCMNEIRKQVQVYTDVNGGW